MNESATLSNIVDGLFAMTPSSGSSLYVNSVTAELASKIADTTLTLKQKPRHQELNCKTFTFVVYVVLFGSTVVFGLVGNTLSFVVLQFDRHSHAATFLLQV